MIKIDFKQVFKSCKTESEVKQVWSELLADTVKAQNARIAELSGNSKKTAAQTKAKDKAEEAGSKKKAAKTVKTEPKEQVQKERKEYKGIDVIKLTSAERKAVDAAGLKYVDYSERSFAITGDTKPVKEIMKKLAGKPNRNLSCGFGWVFAKINEDAVLKSLNLKK